MKRVAIAALLTTITLAACSQSDPSNSQITLSLTRPYSSGPLVEKHFGQTSDGESVEQFTITNAKGSHASFISYGAICTNLFVPDKNNKLGDVVLGYDSVREYELSVPSMCCMVGRFANRIGNATFTIHMPSGSQGYDQEFHVTANQGPNCLHGGLKGLGKRNWSGDMGMSPDGPSVRFTILDPDGAEGFPGNVHITVIYTLTNDDILKMQFLATTDKPTPINLAQHAYFNLSGNGTGENLSYIAHFNARLRYLPMNAMLVPTGELAPVTGTPFDFTKPKPIGRDISPLPGKPPGYDHSFFLNRPKDDTRPHEGPPRSLRPRLRRASSNASPPNPSSTSPTAETCAGIKGNKDEAPNTPPTTASPSKPSTPPTPPTTPIFPAPSSAPAKSTTNSANTNSPSPRRPSSHQ